MSIRRPPLGSTAGTVGLNVPGVAGYYLSFSCNATSLSDGLVIRYTPP